MVFDQLRGALKAADRSASVEALDMKAAEAEKKAAKANQDAARTAAADALHADATIDLDTAKLFKSWKSDELEAVRAAVKFAKSDLDLAESSRDLARVRILIAEKTIFAGQYDAGDYEDTVEKRQKEVEKQRTKATKKQAVADASRVRYERMAKKQPDLDAITTTTD